MRTVQAYSNIARLSNLTEVSVYAKLFASIYQGTLRGRSDSLLVFTNLLAHMDSVGHVDIHPRAIAEEVGLTLDAVRAALDELEAPDPESRSPDEDGRRIVRLDEHRAWGWRVVNGAKYRAIRNEEDRREQNRLAQERWRNKSRPASASVSRDKPRSAQVEVEVEVEVDTEEEANTEFNSPPGVPGVATEPPQAPARPRRAVATRPKAAPAPTAAVWDAYSAAYQTRYGAPPVRNARVNGQLAQLVARLGAEEAPHVAAHYVGHNGAYYVRSMHDTAALLRDAEKLRTEWATGRRVTQTAATQVDRTQTNYDSFAPLIAEARAREAAEARARGEAA